MEGRALVREHHRKYNNGLLRQAVELLEKHPVITGIALVLAPGFLAILGDFQSTITSFLFSIPIDILDRSASFALLPFIIFGSILLVLYWLDIANLFSNSSAIPRRAILKLLANSLITSLFVFLSVLFWLYFTLSLDASYIPPTYSLEYILGFVLLVVQTPPIELIWLLMILGIIIALLASPIIVPLIRSKLCRNSNIKIKFVDEFSNSKKGDLAHSYLAGIQIFCVVLIMAYLIMSSFLLDSQGHGIVELDGQKYAIITANDQEYFIERCELRNNDRLIVVDTSSFRLIPKENLEVTTYPNAEIKLTKSLKEN